MQCAFLTLHACEMPTELRHQYMSSEQMNYLMCDLPYQGFAMLYA
jgi:hypothetical protein